jgi:hypothetical protein
MIELRHNNVPDAAYSPFDEGWNERIDGIQQSDNPFGITNWKFYEWEKGWLEADEAIQKEEQGSS